MTKALQKQIPFSIECFDVMDLAELKSVVGDKFVFTKKIE